MRTVLLAAVLGVVVPVGIAEAHIHLLQPTSRAIDATGNPQKERHCGSAAVTRDPTKVTTYKPGQTITVMWAETIDHPGWFRIAFQPNGEVFEVPPASTGNAGDGTASNYPTEDLTGMTHAATGTMILKDRIADGTSQIDITLPNIECANCTLQFIQVMTNNKPYDADTNTASNDLYFNCADLILANNAPDAGAVTGGDDAGTDMGSGTNSGKLSGGCSAGGGATGIPVALALLGFIGVRRRRRA